MLTTLLVTLVAMGALAGAVDRQSSGRASPADAGSRDTDRYAAVARGRVDVEGGLLELDVSIPGTVIDVGAREGDHVNQGQLLARLDTQVARARVGIAQAKLEQVRARLDVLGGHLTAARQYAAKLRAAANADAGSAHEADIAEQSARQIAGGRAAALAQQNIDKSQIAIAQYQLASHRIVAPVAGRITAVHIQSGSQTTASGSHAFDLLPDRQRIIRAELNQEYVDAVHHGMRAQVVLDNDGQSLLGSAHVMRVGDIFHASTLQDNPALSAGTRTVPCVLAFDQPSHLRIGQLVLVRILADSADTATP